MGNSSSSGGLSQSEVDRLKSNTVLTAEEIRALHGHFAAISSSKSKISRSQFQEAMLFRDSVLVDRIFRVFDANRDDAISFEEYINCLSTLSNKASDEDKLKLSFQMYDYDGDGKISSTELNSLLTATLREHGLIISEAQIKEIVTATLATPGLSQPGFINYQEYKRMASAEPLTLSQLTLNISRYDAMIL